MALIGAGLVRVEPGEVEVVMPAGTGILTIEYKLNCLAPGAVD